jgi:translation initiation factor IF-3
MKAPPTVKEGPRVNEEIDVPKVQLIDESGTNHGVVDIDTALAMAEESGLDLVEIAPNSSPPVTKIARTVMRTTMVLV